MREKLLKQEMIFIGLGAIAGIAFSVLVIRFGLLANHDANDLAFDVSLIPIGIAMLTSFLGSGIVYLLSGDDPRSLQFKNLDINTAIDQAIDTGSMWKVIAGNAFYLIRAITCLLLGWILSTLILTGHLLFN